MSSAIFMKKSVPVFEGKARLSPKVHATSLSLLMFFAFALRLIGIERQSLWIDEGWSIWFSRLTLSELWGDAAKIELHPPLYYTLLKLWISFFGESDFALRSLSAFINALTVPLVYFGARRAAPRRGHLVGMLAAALFGLAYMQVQYSHEARTYALLVFATAAVMTSSVFIVCRFHDRAVGEELGGRLPWVAFAMLGLSMALAGWSHNIGFLNAAPTTLCLAVWWLVGTRASATVLVRLFFAAGVFLVTAGRALWVLLAYSLDNASNFWLEPPDVYQLMLQLTLVFGADFNTGDFKYEIFLRAVLFVPWPVLGVWAAVRARQPRVRWATWVLVVQSLGLVATNVAVTYTIKPVFMPRTVLPAQAAWAALCGLSIFGVAERFRRPAAVLVSACFVAGVVSYHFVNPRGLYKPPWRDAVAVVADEAAPGAIVYTLANREALVSHYLARAGRSDIVVASLPRPLSVPDVSSCYETTAGCPFFSEPTTEQDFARVAARLASRQSTWLIFEQGNTLLPTSGRAVYAMLQSRGDEAQQLAKDHRTFGDVEVYSAYSVRLP